MSRFSVALVLALIFCARLCAESLVYIFDGPTNNTHLAILKGANDALKDFNLRYGKNFKAVDFSQGKGDISQAQLLKEAAKDPQNIGAAVIPLESSKGELEAQVILLASKKFPTIALAFPLNQEGALQTISISKDDLLKKLTLDLNSKKDRAKFQILAVISGKDDAFIDEKQALESLSGIKRDVAEALLKIAPVKFISASHFSEFQKKYAAELLALDNYSLVFLSELPLNDVSPLAEDSDRLSAVSIGGNPYMAQYLNSKQITLVAMPDYYGFGYLSAIALVEKYMQNKLPSAKLRNLDSSFFTPLDVGEFNKAWINLN